MPTAPYLALPSLTAVLRQHGHEVVQKDVNIEMYNLFFSHTFLTWVKERLSLKLHELKAREQAKVLTDNEVEQKTCIEAQLSVNVLALAEHAKSAIHTVHSEEFYDSDKLERALNTFRVTMKYISAAYYPASLV